MAALLEWVFETTPSVWSDSITRQAKVTVYLERDAINAQEEEALRKGIEVIRESGIGRGAFGTCCWSSARIGRSPGRSIFIDRDQ